MRCYAIIADHLTLPIDEGLKKVTFEMMRFASNMKDVDIFSSPEDIGINGVSLFKANKLMFSREIRQIMHKREYTDIIYIPAASTTFNSFIRAWLITQQAPKGAIVHVVNSQERNLNKWQWTIVKRLKNIEVISFSHSSCEKYKVQGIKTLELSCGVDINVFKPVSDKEKQVLRKKYNLPLDKKIILHVGHVCNNRNISIFKGLQKNEFQVVIVGSTSMSFENDLANELLGCGIKIWADYNPNVEEFYQLCDLYVFPVLLPNAAIEFPLSVLEAMACGLPVITTRFGALSEYFQESSCFSFLDTDTIPIEKVNELIGGGADSNREIVVERFSWNKVFSKLLGV